MKTVFEIQRGAFEREMRVAAKPVLVHFHTPWCGQCQILKPSLEALAVELEADLQVAQVNLDCSTELAKPYGITEVPTLLLFDRGAPIACLDAWMSTRQMKAQLQGFLADYATHLSIGVGPSRSRSS